MKDDMLQLTSWVGPSWGGNLSCFSHCKLQAGSLQALQWVMLYYL